MTKTFAQLYEQFTNEFEIQISRIKFLYNIGLTEADDRNDDLLGNNCMAY